MHYVYPGGRSNLTRSPTRENQSYHTHTFRVLCPVRSDQLNPGFCLSRPVFFFFLSFCWQCRCRCRSTRGDAKRQMQRLKIIFLPVASERPTSISTSNQKLIVDCGWHPYAVLPNSWLREKMDRNTASMSGVQDRCVISGRAKALPHRLRRVAGEVGKVSARCGLMFLFFRLLFASFAVAQSSSVM